MDIGQLVGKAILDVSDWINGADQAMSAIADLSAAAAAVGAATAAGIGAMAGIGIEVASNADRATVALGVMMKDTKAAGELMAEIRKMAAATPFESSDLVAGAQSLMSMGFAAEEVIPTLTALGDAAAAAPAGMQAALPLIVRAFGQIRAKGKVSMEELYQLGENGVGAIGMIAESLGVTVAEAMKRVESGGLDAATGLNALMQGIERDLGGMMQKQSQTLDGVLSTLSDTFKMALGDLAAPLVDALTAAVPAVSDLAGAMVAGLEPFIGVMTSGVNAAADMVRAFNETDAAARAMGAGGVASVGLLIGAVGAVVYTANAATAAVGTLATAVAGLEAVAAPLLAVAGAVGVVGAAFYALYTAFATEGEGMLDFLARIGDVIYAKMQPAIEAATQAAAAFGAGFMAGLGDIRPLVAQLGAALVRLGGVAMEVIGLLGLADWQVWYKIGTAVGAVATTVAGRLVDGLAEVLDFFAAINDMMGPMIAGIGRVASAMVGLVSGATDLKGVLEGIGAGFRAALVTPFAASMSIIVKIAAGVAGEIADIMQAIPGVAGSPAVAALRDLESRGSALAQDIMRQTTESIRGGLKINMELDAAAVDVATGGITFNMEEAAGAVGGFNMETDAAAGGMMRYGNALAHLTGQTEAATKAAKKKAEEEVDIGKLAEMFAAQYDARDNPAADFLRDFYADVQRASDATDIAGVQADLAIAMTAHSLTMDQVVAAEAAVAQRTRQILAALPESSEAEKMGAVLKFGAPTDLGSQIRGWIKKVMAGLDPVADDFKDLGAATGRIADAIGQVAGGVGNIMLDALGGLGEAIRAGIEGAKQGGAAGAVVAVVGSMMSQTESFKNLAANLTDQFTVMVSALDPLVKGIGMVLTPVMDMAGVILTGLKPAFEFAARILGMLSPALMALSAGLQGIGVILDVAFKVLEPLMPIVEVAFMGLFRVMQGVSLVVLSVAWLIGSAWNMVLDGVIRLLAWINDKVGGMDDAIAKIRDMKADTGGMEEAMRALTDMTYASAYATAEASASTAMLAESAADAAESLTNVPSGYKVALARFEATQAQTMGGAAAGMSAGGGAGGIVVENLYISAQDPEELAVKLEQLAKTKAYRYTGTSLIGQAPRYSGSGSGP